MQVLLPPGWPRPKGYANGVAASGRPAARAPLGTPPNRTEWRSLETKPFAERHGGIAKQVAGEYIVGEIGGEV